MCSDGSIVKISNEEKVARKSKISTKASALIGVILGAILTEIIHIVSEWLSK